MGIVFSNPNFDPVKEEYIHAYSKDVLWDKARIVDANIRPQNILQRYLDKLRQLNIQTYDTKNYQALKTLSEFNDNDLVQIFDGAVNQLNNKLAHGEDLADLRKKLEAMQSANSASRARVDVFSNSTIDKNEFQDFMNAILQGLQVVSSMPATKWKDFSAAYLLMANQIKSENITTKQLNERFNEAIVSFDSIERGREVVDKVVSNLRTVLDKMNKSKDKSYSAQSMSTSLNNIISTHIGEYLAVIENNILLKVDQEVLKALRAVNPGRKFPNTGAKTGGIGTSGYSDSTSDRKSTSRVDVVFQQAGLNIQTKLSGNDKNFFIQGELNSSVKWYVDKGAKGEDPSKVKIFSSSNYLNFVKQIFGESMYGAYNSLVFRDDTNQAKENTKIIRSSVVANYFDLFIAGKGTQLSKDSGIDLASFLIINGKFYSIASIIQAYLNDTKDRLTSNKEASLAFVELSGINKATHWEGDINEKDLTLALVRSNRIKQQMDKIDLTVHINIQRLKILLQRYGIQPI